MYQAQRWRLQQEDARSQSEKVEPMYFDLSTAAVHAASATTGRVDVWRRGDKVEVRRLYCSQRNQMLLRSRGRQNQQRPAPRRSGKVTNGQEHWMVCLGLLRQDAM